MWKRVLLASDLSPASEAATRTAVDLVRTIGAQLHVVHVLEPPFEAPQWFVPLESWERGMYEGVAKRAEEAARAGLREALARGGATADIHVRRGIAADTIVSTAADLHADVLVLGTHGRTGLPHALLGSIAERVARTCPCPVLIVRGERPEKK